MYTLFLFNFSLEIDIDECSTSVHNCHKHSACNNNDGSFGCTCNSGYSGNGISCIGKQVFGNALETTKEILH